MISEKPLHIFPDHASSRKPRLLPHQQLHPLDPAPRAMVGEKRCAAKCS
jgi:hypothetical protein